MTRENFERLKIGDKVNLYGYVGTVTRKGSMTYDIKIKALGETVSFAWNEGELV